jgi:benzoylformate decarboxylase
MSDQHTSTNAATGIDEPGQGADLFFQAAIHYGYRYVFGNPGTTEAAFMDALVRYPDLRFVLCLHESVATGAADGLARLTGWPALVNLHLAPGLANGLSNIHNARQARVPMVVTVGEHDTRHMLEESPLAGDIEGLARTMCKWTWTVKDSGELAAALHRATTVAMTPPRGPVCLILPTNLLTAPPRTPAGKEPEIPALHLPQPAPAAARDIARAVEALLDARHPVLLVGDLEPAALAHIPLLAKLIGARVVYGGFPRRFEGRPLPGSVHFPYFPEQRRAFLAQADLLFLLGVGGFTTHFLYERDPERVVGPSTRVVHLDDDVAALGKNERGSLPLYGDVAATLERLVVALRERSADRTLRADNPGREEPEHEGGTIRALKGPGTDVGNKSELPLAMAGRDIAGGNPLLQREEGALHPRVLMQALRQVMPAGAILVDEAITAKEALVADVLDAGAPVETYLASPGGSLGAGIPLAMGAQLGAPGRPVVAVIGDGSAMYTIQALWTAKHYRLPILTIICNNASYDIIKVEILRLQGTLARRVSREGSSSLQAITGLGEPRLDFAQLAAGMGVQGWVVHRAAELMPALQAALDTCARGTPALVDVHLPAVPVASAQ